MTQCIPQLKNKYFYLCVFFHQRTWTPPWHRTGVWLCRGLSALKKNRSSVLTNVAYACRCLEGQTSEWYFTYRCGPNWNVQQQKHKNTKGPKRFSKDEVRLVQQLVSEMVLMMTLPDEQWQNLVVIETAKWSHPVTSILMYTQLRLLRIITSRGHNVVQHLF